jgi:hypothetical protein
MLQTALLEDEGDKNDVLRHKRGGERRYMYDAVFGEDSTQVSRETSTLILTAHLHAVHNKSSDTIVVIKRFTNTRTDSPRVN